MNVASLITCSGHLAVLAPHIVSYRDHIKEAHKSKLCMQCIFGLCIYTVYAVYAYLYIQYSFGVY